MPKQYNFKCASCGTEHYGIDCNNCMELRLRAQNAEQVLREQMDRVADLKELLTYAHKELEIIKMNEEVKDKYRQLQEQGGVSREVCPRCEELEDKLNTRNCPVESGYCDAIERLEKRIAELEKALHDAVDMLMDMRQPTDDQITEWDALLR